MNFVLTRKGYDKLIVEREKLEAAKNYGINSIANKRFKRVSPFLHAVWVLGRIWWSRKMVINHFIKGKGKKDARSLKGSIYQFFSTAPGNKRNERKWSTYLYLTSCIPDDMMLVKDAFHSTVHVKVVGVPTGHYSTTSADVLEFCGPDELDAAGLVAG